MPDVRRVLYFDHNATHPLSATAKRVWLEAVEKFPANPSSPHRLGQRAEAALDDARARLGKMLGCPPTDIVFTSGATESANMALAAFGHVEASPFEHPCVLEAMRAHDRMRLRGGYLGPTLGLTVRSEDPPEWAPGHERLHALMAANNETGVLMPWREKMEFCCAPGRRYFCDAAQWIGKLPAAGLGACDFVAGCAHKFGGPQGVGFLKCARDFPALLHGGPQEDGRRAGTENVAGILAMIAALEEREAAMHTIPARLAWRDHFENELLAAVPGARIVGAGSERLWNTVSVIMPGQPDCRRRWVVVMDKLGFAVSTGSACASGKEKPSHVLTAMGFTPEEAGRALRFSAGWETTADDWARLLEGVKAAVREMGCV